MDRDLVNALDILYNILWIVFTSIASVYIGQALAALLVGAAAIIATVLVTFLVGLLGFAIHYILSQYLQDEYGCVWADVKDPYLHKIWIFPTSFEFGLKLGAIWWFGIEIFFGSPTTPIIVPSFEIERHQVTNW